MNYTTNYHLPQWVESDRIMMEDFNQMCADIDQGIKTAQDTAEALPYVTGSYTGNGSTQTINLGFKPSFVIITAQSADVIGATALLGYTAVSGGSQISRVLSFGETGFTVTRVTQIFPATNDSGTLYSYIAFR